VIIWQHVAAEREREREREWQGWRKLYRVIIWQHVAAEREEIAGVDKVIQGDNLATCCC
jgi:hypothetical protein